jgi:hypothetical protein
MSAHERSGYRDHDLSTRHRTWGRDCPAVDIDSLTTDEGVFTYTLALAEYDHGEVRLLADYKHRFLEDWHTVPVDHDSAQRALARLAERAGVPFAVVVYQAADAGPWHFRVRTVDDRSEELLPDYVDGPMPEADFVSWLYEVRGRTAPAELLDGLRDL